MIEAILNEFIALTKIPRPSGHEEAVAMYLETYGRDLGLTIKRDEINNVIMEVPATEGYEKTPLVILQSHTDMVCVGGEGYNPLTDPIIPVIQGDIMRAKGTSLGADDGIGVAMMLALAKSDAPHGPLRFLFTADEEAGMSGAMALTQEDLEAPYLINLDWEDDDSLCIGCASCGTVFYEKPMAEKIIGGLSYVLEISSLQGGHSGSEIHENRGNAIAWAGMFLDGLVKAEIPFSLVYIEGGKAFNVIAPECKVGFSIPQGFEDGVETVFQGVLSALTKEYPQENAATVTLEKTKDFAMGFLEGDSVEVAKFLSQCPQGVYETANGLVVTSSNMGLISTEKEGLSFGISFRSNVDAKEAALIEKVTALGESLGFREASVSRGCAWTPKPYTALEALAVAAYTDLGYGDVKVESIHAGLECAVFAQINPNLTMISLGPKVSQCHSVNEEVYLNTLPKAMNWLQEILKRIK